MKKRFALVVGVIVAVWTVCATVACGSSCTVDADCPTSGKYFCCAGTCASDDAANCGACGNACLLGTQCVADHCVGTGASACAITEAVSASSGSSGACTLQASWKCISPSDVLCNCDGKTPGGDCVCPSTIHVQAPFMCPTCGATIEQLTQLSTLCNVSAPTP